MNLLILLLLLVFTMAIYSQELQIQSRTGKCLGFDISTEYPVYPYNLISNRMKNFQIAQEAENQQSNHFETDQSSYNQASFRRFFQSNAHFVNMLPMHRKLGRTKPEHTMNMLLNRYTTETTVSIQTVSSPLPPASTSLSTPLTEVPTTTDIVMTSISEQYLQSLESFGRKFYNVTFNKLNAISPPSRRENGMSFVQSSLFLHLSLMALSTDVGPEVKREIDDILDFKVSDQERIELINATVSSLPTSSDDLKFRWSSRLVLMTQTVSQQFLTNAAPALRLSVDRFNGSETAKEVALALNHMVELDSGGAIHDTFDEDDFSDEIRAVLISTLYLRARWRSAPTLLNGSRTFRDSNDAPHRTVRMIRVNDVMRYADLAEVDAEALEIFYFAPGLSLLMLVPRGTSLRRLADQTANMSLTAITERMQPLRIAASLPLYTLRMTLLLPNKLEAMNITHLVSAGEGQKESFRLSHAVQRIMFWAEAGRNAYKDDGVEWDEAPQREIVVDRPYIFYVRWKNKTLMNGNFVL